MKLRLFAVTCLALLAGAALPAAESVRREWTINGGVREALICLPTAASDKPAPLVFVFHGHGGTMQAMARRYKMEQLWPEAIVVYPQGLNTPGRLTDPEGKKPGWQHAVGQQDDRDLKLFDAMLATVQQEQKVDAKRIYVTGHSNGGGFTYLLWAERGDTFAAVAPTAASLTPAMAAKLKPKPALHLAGETDPLVKYEWQQETMKAIRRINQCGEGAAWGPKYCTLYPSKNGTPVVTYIHPGAHGFPLEAAPVIAKFFKEHAKP